MTKQYQQWSRGMKTYLEPTDPDAFLDFPSKKEAKPNYGYTEECPKCMGYGGWNLRVNAYPLHHREDNAENRHKHSHFKQSCYHCVGWGFVRPEDADHVHDWHHVKVLGNCLNLYECSVCNKKWQVDSSD